MSKTYPRTFPTICFRSSHSNPWYKSMSSTGLLSPLVNSSWFFASGLALINLEIAKRVGRWTTAPIRSGHVPLPAEHCVMCLQHAMNDGNVRSWDLVYGDVARLVALVDRVCQEEEIATIECGFHRAAAAPRFVSVSGLSGVAA